MDVSPVLQAALAVALIGAIEWAKNQKWIKLGVFIIPWAMLVAAGGFVLYTLFVVHDASAQSLVSAALEGAVVGLLAGGIRRTWDKIRGKA